MTTTTLKHAKTTDTQLLELLSTMKCRKGVFTDEPKSTKLLDYFNNYPVELTYELNEETAIAPQYSRNAFDKIEDGSSHQDTEVLRVAYFDNITNFKLKSKDDLWVTPLDTDPWSNEDYERAIFERIYYNMYKAECTKSIKYFGATLYSINVITDVDPLKDKDGNEYIPTTFEDVGSYSATTEGYLVVLSKRVYNIDNKDCVNTPWSDN